ncbi:MAG: PQQ-binding-like beta-propeller repeat protein, partial [Pyrinomonadaceae bacterium]|nr:PQQ-binding-like beta-propeller repeat protein [Pyrinomonadaceae bacterium]
MRRFIYLGLLLLSAALIIRTTSLAQSTPDALLGTWTGQAHYAGESKLIALRFELNGKGSKVLFFDIPDLKFHRMGPIAVTQQGEQYKASEFSFQLAPDKSITGTLSFDGHDLPFKLEPGSLPVVPESPPLAGPIAQPVWKFKTGEAIWSSPSVADNTVYFGSNDSMIYALNARNGSEVWRFKTGGRVLGCPTLDGPFLYALSDDGYLYKLVRRSAKLVWKFDTHGGAVARDFPSATSPTYDYLTSAATVSDGLVFIGSADKKLYAVDADTGQEKWHFETKGIV